MTTDSSTPEPGGSDLIAVGPMGDPDRYRLIRLLGAGGEGEVWLGASVAAPQTRLAIKIIPLPPADPVAWQTWVSTVTSFDHPGLVRVHEVFTGPPRHRSNQDDAVSNAVDSQYRYVVMDFIEGTSLSDWIIDHPDARFADRRRMMVELARALDRLHAVDGRTAAAAHGDVKPQNVIVTPANHPVLLDLGLSRLTTSSGFAGRSNAYAAPELRGEVLQASTEADAFAFMLTTAAVYTGSAPPVDETGYLDEDRLATRLRHASTTRRRPLVRRAVVGGLAAQPTARPRHLDRWVRRPRREATALATAVLLLFVAAGTAAAVSRPASRGPHAALGTDSPGGQDTAAAIPALVTSGLTSSPSVTAKESSQTLHLAMDWPGSLGCGYAEVAAPASVDLPGVFGSDGIVRVVIEHGGSPWGVGYAAVTFSGTRGSTIHLRQLTVTRHPISAPRWILLEVAPPHVVGTLPCGTGGNPPYAFGYFNENLDSDRLAIMPARGDSAFGSVVLGSGRHDAPFYYAGISTVACDGNYSFSVSATYTVGSDLTVRTVSSDTYVLYGLARNTTVVTGYQTSSGGIANALPSTRRSGSNPTACSTDPGAAPLMVPVQLPAGYSSPLTSSSLAAPTSTSSASQSPSASTTSSTSSSTSASPTESPTSSSTSP